MRNSKEKEMLKFLGYLKDLEVIEALGVARFLGMKIDLREDGTSADTQSAASIQEGDYDIFLSELLDVFIKSSKNKRKMILHIMKLATSK